MARPVIGIPCYAGKRAGTLRPLYGNNRAYSKAVEMAGGTPVLIPHFDDLAALEPLCSRLDGLLLPGGIDIHPRQYGEEPHPLLGTVDLDEDRLDLALANYFLEMDLPILGICRGLQLLNIAARGTLYQDIHDQRPQSLKHAHTGKPRTYRAHVINITPGTRLADLLGAEPLMVNSFHHQGVKSLGRNALVSATAPDGLIEGMEFPNHRFVVAVQCHPEEHTVAGDERALRLFQGFIQAATRSTTSTYRVAS
ncbi:MAG TPA: gamma-glutamyl-gamma-aminobutyrate hydrolase family protein [Ktedonobacterales bacterium]|nr:gamma-glutamyl-gamma-aminobutyrate hydrolase family protein [Ktedonobacterales bacterium]